MVRHALCAKNKKYFKQEKCFEAEVRIITLKMKLYKHKNVNLWTQHNFTV